MPLLTPQQTIRFFILGLPLGLIASGIFAMWIYFRVDAVRQQRTNRAPLRRALNEADLRAYVHTLSVGIGPRHAGAPETLSSARKYLQSTLGPANLGFAVSRHEYEEAGQTFYNLIIDLPGTVGAHAAEIVMVTANYDTTADSPGADANASGTAALMSLAQSFAGTVSARTLRFVALVNESPPRAGTAGTGGAAYAASLKVRQDKVMAVIALEGLGCYLETPGSQQFPAGPAAPWPDKGDFLSLTVNAPANPRMENLAAEFKTATRLPLVAIASAGLPALLGGGTASGFDAAGFPVLRFSDTGGLRNPGWQKPGDTAERLDYPKFLEAVRGIEAVIRALLNPSGSRS